MAALRRNEWWAVCHAHNGEPFCTNGQAALFETRRKADTYRRERVRALGAWNVRVRKVAVISPA